MLADADCARAVARGSRRLQDGGGAVRTYHRLDLEHRNLRMMLLHLQRSQCLAAWASFAASAVVGLAAVASTLIALRAMP